jgi:NAD(P)H-hydrate epimerase
MEPPPAQVLLDSRWTRREARAFDEKAQRDWGVAGEILMENAGAAVAATALDWMARMGCARVACVCGTGNNGGDGFVAARHLYRSAAVAVFLAGPREKIRGDALANLLRFERISGKMLQYGEPPALAAFAAAGPCVVLDAIFGIGLDRPVSGREAGWIEAINSSGRPVLAVDVPSGLDADTGLSLGCAVRAGLTVTFVASKQGFYVGDGPAHAGRIVVAGIGVPALP